IEFRAKLTRRNELGADPPLGRPRQDSGAGRVAEHNGHFPRHPASATRLGDGRHVRALARTEDGKSVFFPLAHAPILLTEGRFNTRRKPAASESTRFESPLPNAGPMV